MDTLLQRRQCTKIDETKLQSKSKRKTFHQHHKFVWLNKRTSCVSVAATLCVTYVLVFIVSIIKSTVEALAFISRLSVHVSIYIIHSGANSQIELCITCNRYLQCLTFRFRKDFALMMLQQKHSFEVLYLITNKKLQE